MFGICRWLIGLVAACVVGGVIAAHMELGLFWSIVFGGSVGVLYGSVVEIRP